MFQLVTTGAGPVLTPQASYEQNGRGQQGDAKNQISKLYTFQFQRRRILKMGSFVPTCDPRGGANLDPRSMQTW